MLVRKIAILFFISCIFFGTFQEVVIYISFRINQSYIAKNLCINRYQAKSTCHGKCMLKQFIQEDQGDPTPVQLPVTENRQNFDFIPFSTSSFLITEGVGQCADYMNENKLFARSYISKIFHPPQV